MATGYLFDKQHWGLVWENPDPTQTFPAQTITLPDIGVPNNANYIKSPKFLKMAYLYSTSYIQNEFCSIIPLVPSGSNGFPIQLIANIAGNSYLVMRQRNVDLTYIRISAPVGTTPAIATIELEIGIDYQKSFNSTTRSTGTGIYLIPYKIWIGG